MPVTVLGSSSTTVTQRGALYGVTPICGTRKMTNVTSAAVFDAAGARVQASAMGLTSVLTQVIVLPAPVLAGWLVVRFGYGSAFVLSAGFMVLGALVMLPLRLYRGIGRTPRFPA